MKKEIIYYSDGELDEKILKICQTQILKADLPIISVTLKPMDFGRNIYLPYLRGYVTMATQILTGLRDSDADFVFFCEHDVLYPSCHFYFTPIKEDVYYYNTNVWKVRYEDGHALYTEGLKQLSQLCASREFLIKHYEKRVKLLEEAAIDKCVKEFNKYVRAMGFEPGTHGRAERVDDYTSESWKSEVPLIDIRHSSNLTPNRWSKDQFINKRYTEGWLESDNIPGWGKFKEVFNL